MLQLLGHVSDDGFRACLENQLLFDEGGHGVRRTHDSMLVCFYLCDIAAINATIMAALRMARMLGDDSERFLQVDLFPIQNVMSYNYYRHPLVDRGQKKTDE